MEDRENLARRIRAKPPLGTHHVILGSGQTAGLGVGNKGTLLDRAARAGLPVPKGLILLDSAWQESLAVGLIIIQNNTVFAPDPAGLVNYLQLNTLTHSFSETPPHPRSSVSGLRSSLAVRSAFSAEDRESESLAGFFTSRLFVDPTDPAQFAAALAEVWASALKQPGEFRRDVLIMQMVAAQHAGVAFTERDFEDDLINFTSGTADTLVAGEVEGKQIFLPKLRKMDDLGFGIWDLRFVTQSQITMEYSVTAITSRYSPRLRFGRLGH
jgi:pyruvate,water dikinase